MEETGTRAKKKSRITPAYWGIIGAVSLLLAYFAVLTLANSFAHAVEQFLEMWYWFALLVVGFGIQVGLYAFIRQSQWGAASGKVAAAAGGISTTSMVACCAHHVTDVLPLIGLSAAAIFLNKYQTLFIVVGVLSNLIGINIMLNIIQKHNLHSSQEGALAFFMRWDMKRALYATLAFSGAALFAALLFTV